MKYRVIERFDDITDGMHRYNAGDQYPRDGASPSHARISELLTGKNRRGIPLIEKIEEPVEEETPKRKKRED